MAPIQNGGMFTLRLLISKNGVRFLCLSYVGNMTGHLKMVDWSHLGHSPPYQLRGGLIN